MTEWQECRLGTVCTQVLTGGTPLTKNPEYFENGKIPWLKTKEVNFCRITDTEYFITEQGLANSAAKLIPANSVIVAMYGQGDTAGRVAINKIPLTTNQACCNLVIDDTVADYQFIYYLLKNSYVELVQRKTGSAQPNLNTKLIKDFDILLPPLPEQEAITAVLSSLDDKIDLLHRQNKTLESMAQTLFRHWFIAGAADDWEIVTVGDFAQLNASSIQRDYEHSQIEYLDTGSITEGKIAGFQQHPLQDAPSRAKRLVKHNDVLYSTVRPNQKHYGIIKNPQPNLVVSTGFCVITCDRIDPHFVYLLLTQPDMTEFLHSVAEGSTSTYPSLKPSDIASVEFQLPPREKLEVFSKLANDSWAKIDHNHAQIRTLEKLRDTLLPKLMSGEVRVRL